MVEGAAKQTPAEKDAPVQGKPDQQPTKLQNEGNSQAKPDQPASTAGADRHLPGVTLTDQPQEQPKPPPPRLDQATLDKKAEELHDAIHRKNNWKFWDSDDPDKDKIFRILEPMGKEDRAALEKIYHDKYDAKGNGDTLRHDLKDKLGGNDGVDWRRSEAILNRDDNRTNDAGALMVAITHAKDDKDKGNVELRQVFETLNSKQIAQLDEDFKKQYGMSYQDALKKANLTDATKEALPIIEKGTDLKTKDDVQKLAEIALNRKDARLFGEALRGDSPGATEFRKWLNTEPPSPEAQQWKERVAQQFENPAAKYLKNEDRDAYNKLTLEQKTDQMMVDYMKEGRVSLATITSENASSFLGLLDNKDNIELAARNASDKERQQFNEGRAHANDNPPDPKFKESVDFYNKIHKAFKDHGNDREVAIFEDQLAHGRETIITQLAKGHDDGWGPFHWGSGHSMNDLMGKVENMSAEDWKLLHDEKTANPPTDTFRKQIEDSLKYADEGERKRIMDLIDKKAAAGSAEDAAKIGRSISETIEDNKGHAFLWFGTSYNGKNILNKVETINADEAKKYKDDPKFRDDLNKFVNENLNDEEKLLAHRLLDKINQTGQPPQKDAVDTLLHDKINGAKPDQLLRDTEAAFKADPALRERLNKPFNELSDDDKKLKGVIEDALINVSFTVGGYPPEYGGGYANEYQHYHDELFSKDGLSLKSKLELNYPKDQLLVDIAKAPEAQRGDVMKGLSKEEQAIVTSIAGNQPPGEPTLADKMRIYTVTGQGNPAEFKGALGELGKGDHGGIQKLKDEYNKKYGVDLDNDFLNKIKDDKNFKNEANVFKDLLTPGESDGRQRFYDNYRDALKSFGTGFSADGSGLTLQRSLDENANQLEAYQRIYQTLPKEKQEALDKYFNESLEQFKQSKEKLAELVTTVVITAAALAATPFTGGASLALVGAIAFAAAGSAKVLISWGMQGSEFDWSKAGGKFVSGGVEGVLNVVGGKITEGLFSGFNVAGKGLFGEMVGSGLLREGGEAAEARAAQAFTELMANGGKNVTEEGLSKFVATVAPNATEAEALAIRKMATQAVEKNYDAIVNRATRVAFAGVDNAIIGGGAGATSTSVNAVIDGRPLSMDEILKSAMVGAGTGAVVGMLIHGAIEGNDIRIKAKKGPNGENILLPSNPGEKPLVLEDAAGNRRTVEGATEPKPGEKIVDGPTEAPNPNEPYVYERTGIKPHESSPEAVRQSDSFNQNHEIPAGTKLEDGFVYKHSGDGKPVFQINKAELDPLVKELDTAGVRNMAPEERARYIADYVHKKFNPPGSSVEEINNWYKQFLAQHEGKPLTMGDFLREGKGVCAQEATLIKILGDEMGLKVNLVRGDGVAGANDINHVWAEIDTGSGPRIYDPRQEVIGSLPHDAPQYRRGSDIDAPAEKTYKPGDKVEFNGEKDWRVERVNEDGSIELAQSRTKDLDPSNAENWKDFYNLNKDIIERDGGQLVVGREYRTVGSEGTWTFQGNAWGEDGRNVFRFGNDRANIAHVAKGSLDFRPELAGYDPKVTEAKIRNGGSPDAAAAADEYAKLTARLSNVGEGLDPAAAAQLKDLARQRAEAIALAAETNAAGIDKAAVRSLSDINKVLDALADPAKAAKLLEVDPVLKTNKLEALQRVLQATQENPKLAATFDTLLDDSVKVGVVKRYADLLEQVADVRRPGSALAGHVKEFETSNNVMKLLDTTELATGPGGAKEKWMYVPAEHNSAADGMGIDGVFMNPKTGEVIFADMAASDAAVADKVANGKMFGLAAEDRRILNPVARDADTIRRLEKFIGEQRGKQTYDPAGKKAWTTDDFAPETGVGSGDKIPFPTFKPFRSQSDLLNGHLSTIQETQALQQALADKIAARTPAEAARIARTGEDPLQVMYEGATKSINQRRVEQRLVEGLQKDDLIQHAVEVRGKNYDPAATGLRDNPPFRNKNEFDSKIQEIDEAIRNRQYGPENRDALINNARLEFRRQNGRDPMNYIEFDMNPALSDALRNRTADLNGIDVSTLRVYEDGRIGVPETWRNGSVHDIEMGDIYDFAKQMLKPGSANRVSQQEFENLFKSIKELADDPAAQAKFKAALQPPIDKTKLFNDYPGLRVLGDAVTNKPADVVQAATNGRNAASIKEYGATPGEVQAAVGLLPQVAGDGAPMKALIAQRLDEAGIPLEGNKLLAFKERFGPKLKELSNATPKLSEAEIVDRLVNGAVAEKLGKEISADMVGDLVKVVGDPEAAYRAIAELRKTNPKGFANREQLMQAMTDYATNRALSETDEVVAGRWYHIVEQLEGAAAK